jgi:hypothetical protein
VGGNVSFFADPVAAFRNIRRAMKPSGLLLTEPSAKQWLTLGPNIQRLKAWTVLVDVIAATFMCAFG